MTNNNEEEMSSACFLTQCTIEYYKQDMKDIMRFPQFVFNEMTKIKPHITSSIIGTKNDFFYDKQLSSEKWCYVAEWWGRK